MSKALTRTRQGLSARAWAQGTPPSSAKTRPATSALARWAAAGALLGSLVAVLAFAPAHWLAQAVQQASGERLVLSEARGTIWQGSAQLWLTGGAGSQDRAALPQRLNWRLSPGWTALTLSLSADCCTNTPLSVSLQPRLTGMTLQVTDGLSVWPAAVLAGLGTPWNTLRPQGRLQLSSQGLQAQFGQGRWQIQGSAAVEAQSLSSALSTLKPMGNYRLSLQAGPSGAPATLNLSTLDGSLQLSGTGEVGQRLRFTGEANATPGSEDALGNLLNIIGKRQGARSLITLG